MIRNVITYATDHYDSVMKRGSDRFFLRGLYRIVQFVSMTAICLFVFGLFLLIMAGPSMLLDYTGNPYWLLLYLIHAVFAICWAGVDDDW